MIFPGGQNPRSRSPFSQLIRSTGVVVILISVGILFWNYYEFSMNILLGSANIQDRTNSLAKRRLESIRGFSETLKSKYGLDFELIIQEKPFRSAPQTDAKTLFLGVCPEKKQVVLKLPVLMQKSFPAGFVEYVEDKHFKKYWEQNTWQQGIQDCLRLVWNQLDRLKKESNR